MSDSSRDNPFETPSPRGIRLVQATLRVVVAIQCWGYAACALHLAQPFPVLELLQQAYDVPEEQIAQWTEYGSYYLIACGAVSLFRPTWLLLLPLLAWQAGMTTAAVVLGEGRSVILEPALQATRFMVPLTLLLVDFYPPRVKPTLPFCLGSVGLLRLATSAALCGHGLLVLRQFQLGGELVEQITLVGSQLFQVALEPAEVQRSLSVIGIIEIAMGINLLIARNRLVLAGIVFWQLCSVSGDTFAYGLQGYDQTLIRIADVGAPLAVLTFWLTAIREQKPVILPEPGS